MTVWYGVKPGSSPLRPSLPHRLKTGFTGVNELDLSFWGGKSMDSTLLSGMLSSLSGLRSLNLAGNTIDRGWMVTN
jgi:hypothetical protein